MNRAITPHGLKRSWPTSIKTLRGTYNHAQYLDGRREMLQWYADYMEALEGGENVVHGSFGKRA
jgi:hypothetical protein